MNIKITQEQHLELCKWEYEEYLFGSQLHGNAVKNLGEYIVKLLKK